MEGDLDAAALLGLIADEARLKVLGALALGASTAAAVTDATGLPARDVGRALGRLEAVGVVARSGDGYTIDYVFLQDLVRDAAATRPTDADIDPGHAEAAVLRRFFRQGRLTSIPVARQKRLAVLDFLANRFEPGKVYPERDVNRILGEFHDDTAALRRYLVDEEFFERREGFYWRAGGTFVVDAE